jgi:dolichyl-phosphate-mannose-protein mannosyltransferase
MLVGLVGLLSGYNGHFEFKSGETYPAEVPYVAMRVMLAVFGVAMVPLGWYTAVELGMSWRACHLVALMVLCGAYLLLCVTSFVTAELYIDIAWLVISKFILLDAMLLFFTFTTVYCMAKFNNQQHQYVNRLYPCCTLLTYGHSPFSFDWWFWLTATGYSIGCVTRSARISLIQSSILT